MLGFPSHPMERADVDAKALDLMAPHLGDPRAREIIEAVGALDQLKSVGDLIALIAR